MTTELTKAAQQALEALKNVTDYDQINAARRALQSALTASQPAQAGEVDERMAFEAWFDEYHSNACAEFGGIDCTNPKGVAEDAWQARASLPTQPAAQAGEAFESVLIDGVAYDLQAPVAAELLRLHLELQAPPTQPAAQATPEPVGEPAFWVPTKQLQQRETTTRGYLWFSNPQNDSWTPVFTRPAPGVPDVEDLRDRLVAISAAVADSDDRAAQSMLGEILRTLAAAQVKGAAHD